MTGFDLFLLVTTIGVLLLGVWAVLEAKLEGKESEEPQDPEPSDWQWPSANGRKDQ